MARTRLKGLDDGIRRGHPSDRDDPGELVELRIMLQPNLMNDLDLVVKKHGTTRAQVVRQFIRQGIEQLRQPVDIQSVPTLKGDTNE